MSVVNEVTVLFLVLLVGVLCRTLRFFTDETIHGVTQLVINVTLPALTICNMEREFSREILLGFFHCFFLAFCLILVITLLSYHVFFRSNPHPRRVVIAGLLGFSNCGFMGYPIILAVNPDWMIYAVAFNIAYTVASWSVYVSLYGNGRFDPRRILLNPNISAAFIGLAVFCLRITLPPVISRTLSMVGNLTTPLTMLIVGARIVGMRLRDLADRQVHLITLLRLVVIPLISYGFVRLLPVSPDVARTIFLLQAMPCGTLNSMQAELYGGDVSFSARTTAWSALLCIVSVPLICQLL